ncbi:MAG: hypothetical protein ACKPKO_27215 [Candidatus Fonsibacter sp.]
MNIIQTVINLIAQVVGRPPSTLNTLQKIADSINNDPFFLSNTSISNKRKSSNS